MNFRFSPLARDRFAFLFGMDDDALRRHGARRCSVTEKPGFPCRISLADAEEGEEVLLVNFEHQSADTPYRASHAVYVRPQAEEARLGVGEIPTFLRHRMLSLRAFDAEGMLRDADVAAGDAIEPVIARMLDDAAVDCIHVHFAKAGCYAARIDRA